MAYDLSAVGVFDPTGMRGWENRDAARRAAFDAAQACLSQHFGAHYAHSWAQTMREAVDAAITAQGGS